MAPGHHQLVVAVVVGEGGGLEGLRREQLCVRPSYPRRRFDQALGAAVHSQGVEQVGHRLGCPSQIHTPIGNPGGREPTLAVEPLRTASHALPGPHGVEDPIVVGVGRSGGSPLTARCVCSVASAHVHIRGLDKMAF